MCSRFHFQPLWRGGEKKWHYFKQKVPCHHVFALFAKHKSPIHHSFAEGQASKEEVPATKHESLETSVQMEDVDIKPAAFPPYNFLTRCTHARILPDKASPLKSKWDLSLSDSSRLGQRLPTRLASSQALWCVCVRQPQIPDYQEMEWDHQLITHKPSDGNNFQSLVLTWAAVKKALVRWKALDPITNPLSYPVSQILWKF